jgi:DNA-directed RNA polymerase
MYRLRFTDKIADYYDPDLFRNSLFKPSRRPMVCPPVGWTIKLQGGGYLVNTDAPLVHTKSSSQLQIIRKGLLSKKSISADFLKAVNSLQKTPWTINEKILQVIKQHEMDKPKKSMKKKTEIQQSFIIQSKYNLAEDYKNRPFYLPWYLDFRGRMYPESSQISPQSDDIGKSLLLFAKSLPVNDDAMKYLAIYGYNKYESKKLSKEEMICWVEANQKYICQSAEDPFKHNEFWSNANDKYLFLAFCIEWNNIHKNNKTSRVTKLPIYVDGTCNGFQHYSALLLDKKGAGSVNLMRGDRPRDFYGDVSQNILLTAEKEDTDPVLKDLIITFANRKVLKKSIIAAGYGSWHGKRSEALAESVHELSKVIDYPETLSKLFSDMSRDTKSEAPTPMQELTSMCTKIEVLLDAAIKKFNPAFSKVKNWLKRANKIVNDNKECMLWTNHAGFTVYNSYYEYPPIRISVWCNGKSHRFEFKDFYTKKNA